MSNPLSTYDVLYKGMSEEDRARLQSEISEALKVAAEEANKALILGVQKAATEVYGALLVNPWPALIQENGGEYGFISSLSDHIWESMLKMDPSKPSRYQLNDLVRCWQANYPKEWSEAVGEHAAKRIAQLEESLDFQIKCNRREF